MIDFQFNTLNIFAFSDTHGSHRKLQVPENVDILICGGDVVEDNLEGDEYDDFVEWFASLPCKWKIFVPGNHELSFEIGRADGIIQRMTNRGITVLEDAIIDCDGVIIASISGSSSWFSRLANTAISDIAYSVSIAGMQISIDFTFFSENSIAIEPPGIT